MSITIVCQCGAKLKPPDSFTGTKIRCPKCSAIILVSINDIVIVESSESSQIDLNSSGHSSKNSTIKKDSDFKLLCQKCNTIISPITKLPGKIIECSKCKQLLQIPEQDLNNENSDVAESETNIPKKKKKKKKLQIKQPTFLLILQTINIGTQLPLMKCGVMEIDNHRYLLVFYLNFL